MTAAPHRIFVRGIPPAADEEQINEFFSVFGTVVRVDVKKDLQGNSRGFCFVNFEAYEAFEACLAFGTHDFEGTPLEVKRAVEQFACPSPKGSGKGGDTPKSFAGTGIPTPATASQRNDPCKIFIGGIPLRATEDDLVNYFVRYGSIARHEIKYDSATCSSKGYGFVTFHDVASAERAAANRDNHILDKWVDVKSCAVEHGRRPPLATVPQRSVSDPTQSTNPDTYVRKVFAGGLPWDVTEECLKGYFSEFGVVEKVELKVNAQTGRSKGYAFVVFESEDAGQAAVAKNDHWMAGKLVDVHPANQQHSDAPSRPTDPAYRPIQNPMDQNPAIRPLGGVPLGGSKGKSKGKPAPMTLSPPQFEPRYEQQAVYDPAMYQQADPHAYDQQALYDQQVYDQQVYDQQVYDQQVYDQQVYDQQFVQQDPNLQYVVVDPYAADPAYAEAAQVAPQVGEVEADPFHMHSQVRYAPY